MAFLRCFAPVRSRPRSSARTRPRNFMRGTISSEMKTARDADDFQVEEQRSQSLTRTPYRGTPYLTICLPQLCASTHGSAIYSDLYRVACAATSRPRSSLSTRSASPVDYSDAHHARAPTRLSGAAPVHTVSAAGPPARNSGEIVEVRRGVSRRVCVQSIGSDRIGSDRIGLGSFWFAASLDQRSTRYQHELSALLANTSGTHEMLPDRQANAAQVLVCLSPHECDFGRTCRWSTHRRTASAILSVSLRVQPHRGSSSGRAHWENELTGDILTDIEIGASLALSQRFKLEKRV